MSKRPSSPTSGGALMKRARATPPPSTQIAISSANEDRNKGLIRTVARTSNLDAPIVSLAGAHAGEILSCRFDPTGQNVAACSTDRSISLWRTYAPNTNYGLLSSHAKAPILDLQCGSGTELLATGSDDGTVKIWEGGEDAGKQAVATFEVGCPVTSVCWSADGNSVYIGAIDNEVHVYDLRKSEQVSSLVGHTDTPTSLALSPNGSFLLSPSFSSQTFVWDVRPFSPSPSRIHRVLQGAPAGLRTLDDGGNRVAVGGADACGKILYKLPGHKGTVTSVDFHAKEPIILTGSKDGTMLLGEIEAGLSV
ncbi:U5 snRNP complex subunit [Pholiota molesta]|nr:U5 snRNP complex subunit [Pholiota molesta]